MLVLLARGPRMSILQLICTDAVPRARFLEVVFHRRCDSSRSGALFALAQQQWLREMAVRTRNEFLAAEMRQQLGLRAAPYRVNPMGLRAFV